MNNRAKHNEMLANPSKKERLAVFVFGAILVLVYLALALFVPDPTPFQYTVFRIVLALASAGVAAFIPGLIKASVGKAVKAGGAMAVFLIVFFFVPAGLPTQLLPYRLFITVLNENGERVADVEIRANTAEQTQKLGNQWELVLRDREEGDIINVTAHSAFASGTHSVTLGKKKEYHLSIILQKRTDGIITGRVTDPQGNPLSGVTVSVLGHEPDGVKSDETGHYRLKAFAAPGEEVRVTAELGTLSWSDYLPAGESVEIRLKERGR